HIDIQFNEAINAASFTPDDVTLTGPSGTFSPTGVSLLAADTFRVVFPALTVRGNYQAVIGPDITDLAGNKMDQNQNGANGEVPGDRYTVNLVYIVADVIFNSATTINEGDLTYEGRNLLIAASTVTINGSHQFNSVHVVNGGKVTHSANTANQTHQ